MLCDYWEYPTKNSTVNNIYILKRLQPPEATIENLTRQPTNQWKHSVTDTHPFISLNFKDTYETSNLLSVP